MELRELKLTINELALFVLINIYLLLASRRSLMIPLNSSEWPNHKQSQLLVIPTDGFVLCADPQNLHTFFIIIRDEFLRFP